MQWDLNPIGRSLRLAGLPPVAAPDPSVERGDSLIAPLLALLLFVVPGPTVHYLEHHDVVEIAVAQA